MLVGLSLLGCAADDAQLVQSWLSPLAAVLLLSVALPSIVLAVTGSSRDHADDEPGPVACSS